MTDRTAFHLAAKCVKFQRDEFTLTLVNDEHISRRNSADFDVRAEVLTALRKLSANFLVGRNIDPLFIRQPDLTSWFIQRGTVDVMLHSVAGNDDIADQQILGKTARDARIDDDLGMEKVDHDLCADSGIDLSYAAFQQNDVLLKNLSADKIQSRFFVIAAFSISALSPSTSIFSAHIMPIILKLLSAMQ